MTVRHLEKVDILYSNSCNIHKFAKLFDVRFKRFSMENARKIYLKHLHPVVQSKINFFSLTGLAQNLYDMYHTYDLQIGIPAATHAAIHVPSPTLQAMTAAGTLHIKSFTLKTIVYRDLAPNVTPIVAPAAP